MGICEEMDYMEQDSAKRFLEGIHVLAVDEDRASLMFLEALLRYFNCSATMVKDPKTALHMLRKGEGKFDLVISGVLMPYKDGFDILKLAGLEMDLPVIILSAYEDTNTIIKWITLGACDYWVKPVCTKKIMKMWHHVTRKKNSLCNRDKNGGNVDASEKAQSETAGGERVFEKSSMKHSMNERNNGNGSYKNKENMPKWSTRKKPRMTWTKDLKDKFVAAVREIGIDNAVPKKILSMMGVDHITRESVSSYLQKFRLRLKRERDNARMNHNPLDGASERDNSTWNKQGSFNHYHGHGRYCPYAPIASSNPTSHFTRINHQYALGARGELVPGSNMFSKDVVPGSSLLPDVRQWPSSNNSYANMPNNTKRLDAFASCHSGNNSSYAKVLRGKILEIRKDNHGGNSFAYRSNVGMSSSNQFPVLSSSQLGHQPSIKRNPFGEIGNRLGNSWQAATKFPGLGQKDERTSLGPWQENIPNINKLTSLPTSSVVQKPTYCNVPQKQMAEIMSNTTNMAHVYEKTAPFDVLNNNNTSATEMFNGNYALGTTSRASPRLPDLHMDISATPTQMLNCGVADGVLPVQEDGTVHLNAIADQLKYINDCLLETGVPEEIVSMDDNMPNEDFISIYDNLYKELGI